MSEKAELINLVKLLLKSEFFRDLFFVLTGKDREEDLISLFLLSWDEEEALKGKNFGSCRHLIFPLIVAISELGFIEDECYPSSPLPENKDRITFH